MEVYLPFVVQETVSCRKPLTHSHVDQHFTSPVLYPAL